ncbi:low molecular weight protein tyrosine phosphatase family protein [Pseudomonas koreensis]|uniref:low molecular weight protein tyrosine phosphatase family protein n=1 Tax=Pseudomonas koreensis TaxID=198620 RepID=UPI003F84074A
MTNLLFVCSRNQWRSPTAEAIWRRRPGFEARSAGTSPNARKPIGPADIRWADVIFVMERKHLNRLQAEYARLLEHKPIHTLDIPDDYRFMDLELVDILEDAVKPYLAPQA